MDAQIQERLAKQGAEILRLGDELKALKRRKESPSSAAMKAMSEQVEAMRQERDDAIAALPAAQEEALNSVSDTMGRLEEQRNGLEHICHEQTERLQALYDGGRASAPDWRRDFWVDIYKQSHGGDKTARFPHMEADTALREADERFGTPPLDTSDDDSEG